MATTPWRSAVSRGTVPTDIDDSFSAWSECSNAAVLIVVRGRQSRQRQSDTIRDVSHLLVL